MNALIAFIGWGLAILFLSGWLAEIGLGAKVDREARERHRAMECALRRKILDLEERKVRS